jgi:hypothetical protein
VEIVSFLVSSGHAYGGRPADGPAPTDDASPGAIELRAGHGVVGDRYAGRAAHADAQVTLIAVEALEAVADELGVARSDPALARRTVVTRGLDVEALRVGPLAVDAPVPLDPARAGRASSSPRAV